MWARAMYTYDRVAKNIGPKKEALAQAEGELAVVQSELAKKQEALRKVNGVEMTEKIKGVEAKETGAETGNRHGDLCPK